MDKNAIAKQMAEFGHEEVRAMKALRKVQRARCKFLRDCASHPDAGLDDDAVAAASAPKDGGGEN